jgi:hypothetical protein
MGTSMHVRANPRNLESVAHPAISTLESGGRAELKLKFIDELFDCKLGGWLGRGVIRRYDANLTGQRYFRRFIDFACVAMGKSAPKFPTNGSLGAVDLDNEIIGTCKAQERGGISAQLFCHK